MRLPIVHPDTLLRGRLDAGPRVGLLRLLATLIVFGAVYGMTMGSFGGRGWQAVYSGVKVPMLLVVTFALSLPSFFVLNSLRGLRPDFPAVLQALVATQTALTIVLAAFAPLTAFWYVSFRDYEAALMFNAGAFAIASFAGQAWLRRAYRPLIQRDPRHRLMFWCWLLIYAFVGIQMGWVLRPFVGTPDARTQFFRADAWGNAYVEVIGRWLGGGW